MLFSPERDLFRVDLWIHTLIAVSDDYVQCARDVGRQLARKVFERIGTGGHISLCVNTDNEDAIRFYESLGFRRSGRVEGYRKGQDKYWYEIDL